MVRRKKIRIILDTNWYISATINRKSRRRLYNFLTDQSISILYSEKLVEEYNDVMSREKYVRIILPHQTARFAALVISKLQEINVRSSIVMSRDPKDNFLLALSKDGKANYLVTGDEDLLVLNKIGGTRIIKMSEFEKILYSEP